MSGSLRQGNHHFPRSRNRYLWEPPPPFVPFLSVPFVPFPLSECLFFYRSFHAVEAELLVAPALEESLELLGYLSTGHGVDTI